MTPRMVLITRHAKELILAPLAQQFGWVLSHQCYDTDTLGTFAGDVARPAPPLETAILKAQLHPPEEGVWRAASEGTLSSLGLLGAHLTEIVVALSPENGQPVVGAARAPLPVGRVVEVTPTMSPFEIEKALRHHFDEQRFITIRRADNSAPVVRDVTLSDDLLREIVTTVQRGAPVFVHTDLRAHRCPERHAIIHSAAMDLFTRLTTPCPRCGHLGFGLAEIDTGLPCSDCGSPTPQPRAERWRCVACDHQVITPLTAVTADPAHCPACNP